MALEQFIANAFQMSDSVWERHANPWSVWTRYAALPVLVAAIWSRAWIGWWSLLLIVAAVLWIWLNPRIFRRPESTDNWASKAVLGERVWLNRKTVAIPRHHQQCIFWLNLVMSAGLVILVAGLVQSDLGATMIGLTAVVLGKSWFLDRMVWLYEEMTQKHPAYREWLY